MKIAYFVGIIRAELFFRGCRTLKDRRGHLRSLKDRLANMGFSVAQTGPSNLVQRAWLTIVFISGTKRSVERMTDQAEQLFFSPDWELVAFKKDILGDNEILPEWEQI